MEALQMLKFSLKKARMEFTDGWITPQQLMEEAEGAAEEVDFDLLTLLCDDSKAAEFREEMEKLDVSNTML